jgi:hypothetical protein
MSDTQEDDNIVEKSALSSGDSHNNNSCTTEINCETPKSTFTIRPSIESPKMNSYEIVNQENIGDVNLEASLKSKDMPSVKLHRMTSESLMKSTNLDSGLDPMGIDLISSTVNMSSSTDVEIESSVDTSELLAAINNKSSDMEQSSDKSKSDINVSDDKNIVIEDDENLTIDNNETEASHESSSHTANEDISVANVEVVATNSTPKISREMKNLQKSINESKVLSDFQNTSGGVRSRKSLKDSSNASATTVELEQMSDTNTSVTTENDKELPLKNSPSQNDENDSDSTVILRDGSREKKRRKSFSRSRSRGRSVKGRGRQKSMSKQFQEEMETASDKDINHEENEDVDNLPDIPFTASKLIENRSVNPPPKVTKFSFDFLINY